MIVKLIRVPHQLIHGFGYVSGPINHLIRITIFLKTITKKKRYLESREAAAYVMDPMRLLGQKE